VAIRAIADSLSQAYGTTGHRVRDAYAANSIFVSGAYGKPIVGRDTKAEPLRPGERKNQKSRETIRRLDVSKSGDIAWEFTDFRLSWDDPATGKHIDFPGSMLRVWEKIDGRWMIMAEFRRPNEDK
jgi:ketosteroid isomerase-like protein